MKVNQIYSVVNDIAQNVTSGTTTVVDATGFITFGNMVRNDLKLTDMVYNQLWDRIGRTVFAIRNYKRKGRQVRVDSFEFGALLQKISYKLQNAEESSIYSNTAQNPYELQPKGGIIQKIFEGILPAFSHVDVQMNEQLWSAFDSPTAFAGFVSGLYTRMDNAYEVAVEGLEDATVAASIGYLVNDSGNRNYSRRHRNLLAEYRALYPDDAEVTALTAANCLRNKRFLEYMATELAQVPQFIGKLTSMYNDGTVERTTAVEDLIVELSLDAATAFDVYLSANTFHKELVKLPNYSTVPYWSTPAEPDQVNIKIKVPDSTGEAIEEKTVNVTGIIAYFRDREAAVCTLDREKNITLPDKWNSRICFKREAARRYLVDTSENSILFFVAD